ncbi:chemotaxis protein CheA [Pelosinus fermentans]|nr:chemotaxis protein CheA [Pelosinus fermentans]
MKAEIDGLLFDLGRGGSMLKDEKLIQEFVVEAKEHVEKIESGLLSFEQKEYDENVINAIFRSAHNIKGTAGFFGFQKIVELSHAMESVLGKIRSRELALTFDIVDALLMANDELRELLDHITISEERDIASLVKRLQHIYISGKEAQLIEPLDDGDETFIPEIPQKAAKKHKDDADNKMISELGKKGHKIYKYVHALDSQQIDVERFSINMSKSIQSIGTILNCYIRNKNFVTEENFSGQEIVFLFSTVLEKELAVMAIGANPREIEELSISTQSAEIFQLLSETEDKSADPKEEKLLNTKQRALDLSEERIKNDLVEERIKVDVALLNNLVNLSSEMVLARNQLLRLLESHVDGIPGIRAVLQKIDHTTTEMQEKIMRTRMQPISILFHSIPRLVRDLSKKLGKSLTLKMEGKEVEMDKSILEGLIDPFTHLIRNALDHGIEKPEMRKASGKDPTAMIEIKARHEGGRVIIDIMDDGAGIDIEKVKQQALQKGLIGQDEAMDISEGKMAELVFSPGFSTVSQVSDISGRGVGLDVVRSNIEKFGGIVELHTLKGKGTTFRLLLPLTLAIIPSLILAVGKYNFALPQTHLQEIVRIVDGKEAGRLQWIQGRRVLQLRGKLVPIVHLADVISLEKNFEVTSPITRILIIKIAKRTFGIIVDAIHGQEELLVKPMPNHLKEVKVYSGVTILGDGSIAMVLDIDGIASMGNLVFSEEGVESSQSEMVSLENQIQEMQDLLLFQCSGPEILGLHLSMIARVNEISPHQIEEVGNKQYYNSQGDIIQLIRLEQYLPVASKEQSGEKMYVITPKGNNLSLGLLVRAIKDTVQVDSLMVKGDIQGKGLLGSTIINEKIVLLVDLHEIVEMSVPEQYAQLKFDKADVQVLRGEFS